MFVLSQSSSYTWPVTVEFPVSGGKYDKQTFDAEFKRLPQSAIKELTDRAAKGELNDSDFVKEILVGWKGITDGKDEVPFSSQALEQLLEIPLVAAAIAQAFFGSVAGARRKN